MLTQILRIPSWTLKLVEIMQDLVYFQIEGKYNELVRSTSGTSLHKLIPSVYSEQYLEKNQSLPS